jgi:hypothetical protein
MTTKAKDDASPMISLRITGLGNTLTFAHSASATVSSLQEEIARGTGVPAVYQRLLARGHKLEDGNATLAEVGLQDRTKVMLLHNALYAQEKPGWEALAALALKVEALAADPPTDTAALSDRVTRLCCALDAVDTLGSEHLRARRRTLLRQAERLDTAADAAKNANPTAPQAD